MVIKVSEATNVQLDWLVAKCENLNVTIDYSASWRGTSRETNVTWRCYALGTTWEPTTDWSQGGPIIKRELIETRPELLDNEEFSEVWSAFSMSIGGCWHYGPTPLIAAMRAYVTSKLGNEVEIPKELMNVK